MEQVTTINFRRPDWEDVSAANTVEIWPDNLSEVGTQFAIKDVLGAEYELVARQLSVVDCLDCENASLTIEMFETDVLRAGLNVLSRNRGTLDLSNFAKGRLIPVFWF
jgi:hypothetical protein